MTITEARNADLSTLASLLKAQQGDKRDAVVSAANIHSRDSLLHVEGMGTKVEADTVDQLLAGGATAPGIFRPTAGMDGDIADKLGIPVAYLRRLRETRTDLYDANVNGWLHGLTDYGWAVDDPSDPQHAPRRVIAEPDRRKFLVRTFTGEDEGIGRALLSDTYQIIDNLDVLTAAMLGVRKAGREVEVLSADLTEKRMVVRFACPDFAVMAPTLLAGYRPQTGGWTVERARDAAAREASGFAPGTEPVIFAGFELSNSETGGGSFQLLPRATVLMCKNGLKFDVASTLRKVHLGARMDEGAFNWSNETIQKNLDLITAMASDAVATYLDRDWLTAQVAAVEAKAGKELGEPEKVVRHVSKQLRYSDEATDGILSFFIKGAQPTAGGVLNAVTSYAQTIESADVAYDVEASAMKALELAYAAA